MLPPAIIHINTKRVEDNKNPSKSPLKKSLIDWNLISGRWRVGVCKLILRRTNLSVEVFFFKARKEHKYRRERVRLRAVLTPKAFFYFLFSLQEALHQKLIRTANKRFLCTARLLFNGQRRRGCYSMWTVWSVRDWQMSRCMNEVRKL